MEKMKICHIEYDNDPDFDELFMRINTDQSQSAYAVPVNDDTDEPFDVYLDVNPATHQIVGASIYYARNLFEELARALAAKDLSHPDVRFFLEKKLEAYALAHADELKPAPAPVESSRS